MKLRGTRVQYGFLLHRNCFLLINMLENYIKFQISKISQDFKVFKKFQNFQKFHKISKFSKNFKMIKNLKKVKIFITFQN